MEKRGVKPIRPKVVKTPALDVGVLFFWEAFRELNTTRNELGAIPWTAINEYCKRWGVDSPEEFDSFCFFIRGMDNAYLEHKNKELEEKRNKKKGGK